MKIIDKIRNIFQRPKQEDNYALSVQDHDSVTVGDMHGNFLKLWDVLLDQNIFDNGPHSSITDNYYQELGRIHNDYKSYTNFYSSLQDKKKQLNETITDENKKSASSMLPPPKVQECRSQLDSLDKYGYIFEVTNRIPTVDDIKDQTIYCYFVTDSKNKKQLYYAMRSPEGDIIHEAFEKVDKSHFQKIEAEQKKQSSEFSSAPLKDFLAKQAIIAELKANDVFIKPDALKQKLENCKLRFQKILSKATLNPNLPDEFILFLIGDLLSDRGPSDLLTLLTLQKLIHLFKQQAGNDQAKLDKLQSHLKIMISNHDSSFFQWYYKARYENQTSMTEVGIQPSQCVSLQGLGMELDLGLVSMKELDELMDNVYFPHLELFSCSEDVQENSEVHLTIRTHSPSPDDEIIDTIRDMVKFVDPDNANKSNIYQYDTQDNIKKSIDAVNKAFQAKLKTKEGLKQYIDDYKWHMVIGNIQSIANRVKEPLTTKNLDLASLISLVLEVVTMTNSEVPRYANIKTQWDNLNSTLSPEKNFLLDFLESYASNIDTYTSLERDLRKATTEEDRDTAKAAFLEHQEKLITSLQNYTVINKGANLLTTSCPYFKITNNRWIPQDKQKQDQQAKGKNILIDRLYGHVGPSDNPKEQAAQNLDNHHGHGQIPQGTAYTIKLVSSKPLDSEIEDNILYVYKQVDNTEAVLLLYATRTPHDNIVSDQSLLFAEFSDDQFTTPAKKMLENSTATSGPPHESF